MRGATLILVTAAIMLAVGVLTILAWIFYTLYLDRVQRRLAERKSLYRDLVSELATRDRALLEPTIHRMNTLYDLDALEAVLEEQARSATGRPGWLLEVYDRLGLVDKYIEKLRSARKWRDRAFAAELLGRVGNARAVPVLLETVQATHTEDSDVREIALRALARIADPGAVEPLVRALAEAEAWLAPRIADILTRHGELVVEPLIAMLSDSARHPAKAWAANILGEVHAQRAFPVLVRSLEDPDDEVRAKSATALGRLGDRRALGPLLDHLLTDPAPFVRTRIASTLGRFDDPEIVDRLVRALGDPSWWVRMRGVEALEHIGAMAEGPLLLALDDADPEIRQRAAISLERLGVPARLVHMIEHDEQGAEASEALARLATAGTRELMAELLLHSSARVRGAVLAAIRQAGRQDLAAELSQVAAGDPDSYLRARAFDTLRALRSRQGVPAALTGLADSDARVRTAAIQLIGELDGSEGIELLRARTDDPEPAVRAAAAHALGTLGSSAAQPDFLRLTRDPEPAVREATVIAIANARLRRLVPTLIELLDDGNGRVRHTAARALGIMGDSSAVPALLGIFERADPDLRDAIAVTVSRLDPAALSRLLDTMVMSREPGSKLALAHTLGRLRSPGGIELLLSLLPDRNPAVRAAALEALGRAAHRSVPLPESVVQAVTGGFRDEDEAVRSAALDVCGRLCLSDQGGNLLSLLHTDPSARVRERAALAIGLMRVPGGEAALIAACRRTEPASVRAAAALGAGSFNRDSLVTLVMEMPDEASVRGLLRARVASDPWFRLLTRKLPRARDVELRALAASSLETAGISLAQGMRSILDAGERVRIISGLRAFQGEQSRAALLQLARSDPSAEVRTAALAAAGELLDPDELLAVGSRALGDPSIMVRRAAVSIFAKAPPSRAFPRLLRALRLDEDPAVLAAAAGLAEERFSSFRDATLALPLQDSRAVMVARLSRYIHHPDLPALVSPLAASSAPEVREAVADLWWHRPDAADPVALEALTADPVMPVRLVAARAAAAAERYELLDPMTRDPEPGVRREVAIALGRAAPVGRAGLMVLEHLDSDPEMPVRAAVHVARLLQGIPLPLAPGLDLKIAAEAVHDTADLPTLRNLARTAPDEERRLAAALALALIQDEAARDVARADPAPAIRHRVSGALELSIAGPVG